MIRAPSRLQHEYERLRDTYILSLPPLNGSLDATLEHMVQNAGISNVTLILHLCALTRTREALEHLDSR